MIRVACYRVLDTEQYAMCHATGQQREHAGHQKREDIEQHHPDLVLTDIALTGAMNRHGRQRMAGDARDLNEQKRHLAESELNQGCVGGSLSSDSLGGLGRWDTIQRLIRIMQPVTTTTKPNVISINSMAPLPQS